VSEVGLDPFTTRVDLEVGTVDPAHGEIVHRRLADMRGMYHTEPAQLDGSRLVYRVFPIEVPPTGSNLRSSTTVLEPGDVAGEYFMTKGHFHRVRDRAELYLGLAGAGRLVLATEDGRWAVEPIGRGTVSYVPGGWAHRSVNIGDEPLVFFAAYVGDAGHDYATIERRGFPVLVVRGPDGPTVIDNPRYGSR
jgi:glucose-6-phosphate isomerase